MGYGNNPLSISLHLFFFYYCCFLLHTKLARAKTNGMFVFGSSLVDNGNNNFLENSISRADYMPYGMDFALGASGRYSNGKNVIDALGELLKLPSFMPIFKDPMTKGSNITHGVDFASGGSGILDQTGSVARSVITLNQQIKNFEEVTLPDLKAQLGSHRSLSNYLFVIGSGGNDYLFNYFLPTLTTKVSVQNFTANLTQTLSTQIQKLYCLGAQKFVLISIYPLGCIPFVKRTGSPGCVDMLNQAAQLFNSQLKLLVDVLHLKLPGSRLVYVDSYKIINDIILDPTPKGFSDTTTPCCEVPSINGVLCNRGGSACADRRSHVFFDGLHPTEAVNEVIADKGFSSNLRTEVYPINIRQLAMF